MLKHGYFIRESYAFVVSFQRVYRRKLIESPLFVFKCFYKWNYLHFVWIRNIWFWIVYKISGNNVL